MDFLTPEEENIFEAIIDGTIFLALDGITITVFVLKKAGLNAPHFQPAMNLIK